jgi:hypothetical protein
MQTLNFDTIFLYIYDFVTGGAGGFSFIGRFLGFIKPVSLTLSFFFVFGIVFCILKLNELRAERRAKFAAKIVRTGSADEPPIRNKKWLGVVEHIESENENDWRLAILEADIMLEELVEVMGYQGASLGEKLKAIERSDFNTIDKAWEAHKVRNQIAHMGSDFLLSRREAERIINLFKDVFEEFHFI